jgi:hypothetical protein
MFIVPEGFIMPVQPTWRIRGAQPAARTGTGMDQLSRGIIIAGFVFAWRCQLERVVFERGRMEITSPIIQDLK